MILNHLIDKLVNLATPQLKMTKLDNQIIMFCLDGTSWSQKLFFHNQRVETIHVPNREPDLIITGNFNTLYQFLTGNDRAQVTLEGNLKLAVELQHIIQTAQIDWSEYLYQVTGDFPSYLCSFNKTTEENLQLKEKIHELENRIRILEEKNS